MVFGPTPPKGSTTDKRGRTVVPRKFQGPTRPGTNVENFRRTGRSGGGSSSTVSDRGNTTAENERLEAARVARVTSNRAIVAAKKAIADNKAKQEAQRVQAEKQRILALRNKLILAGAQEETKMSKDSRTGDRLRISSWRLRNGNQVQRFQNLDKGTVKYQSFKRAFGGGRIQFGGGFTEGAIPKVSQSLGEVASKVRVSSSNISGRISVALPNGEKITIKNTGRVNVGSRLAGFDLVFQDGILRKVSGKDLFEEKLKPLEREKLNKIVSKKRATELISSYTKNISGIENNLKNSANRGDITRLGELQRKKNLTAAEKKEKERLRRIVANNYKKVGEMVGFSMAMSVLSLGVGSIDLANSLIRDPIGTSKQLPKAVWDGLKQDFSRVRGGPLGALNVAVEYVTLGAALKGVGKITGGTVRTISKLNPKYARKINGQWTLRKAPAEIFKVAGKERFLSKRVLKPSIKRPFSSVSDFLKGRKPGQFKKFTKDPGIILKEQTVKSGALSLAEQAKLAGTEVTAVNAAANQLTSWLGRKKIIRKPFNLTGLEKKFPLGEASFPSKIQRILKKFDAGNKITVREFAQVNQWLQKNVFPNITLLERSLYLDPASGLRISRLGLQKPRTATFKDLLKGNFRLWEKSGKPQVLIFENLKIANFPKSLATIKRKLLNGKKLTTAETNKLIQWQVNNGGTAAKPIGSTIFSGGIEREITIAPGQMIRRLKVIGFDFIEGKKVKFVTAEIFKPTKKLLAKIKKANLGKLSEKQLSTLEKLLSKKLGRKVKIETPKLKKAAAKSSRRLDSNIPVLRVKGSGLFVNSIKRNILSRAKRVKSTIKRITKTTRRAPKTAARRKTVKATRKTVGRKKSARPETKRQKATRVKRPKASRKKSTRPKASRVSKTSKKTKKKPPIILRIPKKFKQKTLRKAQPTFYVVTKKKGKMIKLFAKPLTKEDARDYAVWSIDNNLTRTAFFVPLGKSKKTVRPPVKMNGYYSKNKRKIRPFKIRHGKRKQLLNGYIERSKHILDTRKEKAQMRIARIKSKHKKTRVRNRPTTKRKSLRTRPTASINKKIRRKSVKRRK